MRDMQVNSPASLRSSICQTCVLRPRCKGRAVPVTQPWLVPLRWLALISSPTSVAFWHAENRAARAQRFGQHHRHPAMQQAVGLHGAAVHGHAGADEVVADFEKFNAQVRHRAMGVAGIEPCYRNVLFPDTHRVRFF